jgi:hypothetical protein
VFVRLFVRRFVRVFLRFFKPFKEFSMKKNIMIVAALVVGLAAAFAFSQQSGPKPLAVSDIGSDPAAYTGTITVTGVMGGVSQQDPSVFGVMDVKELQCTTANCNKVFIAVKYQGKPPVLGDELRMTGSFTPANGGYLFVAQSLKVLRNHKIGG